MTGSAQKCQKGPKCLKLDLNGFRIFCNFISRESLAVESRLTPKMTQILKMSLNPVKNSYFENQWPQKVF